MSEIDTILLKIASRCNLDCSYCYVYQGEDTSWKLQPKRMSNETILAIISRLVEISNVQIQGFAIVLHGGEPLLLGITKLRMLFSGLRNSLPCDKYPISIQTNGMLLTNEILNLCSEYRVSVSVSLDGIKQANDIARFDRKGKSSFDEVLKGIQMLAEHPNSDFLFAGTLSVIQPTVSAKSTYNFLRSLNTPSMDFLFQDGNHDRLPFGKSSFESTEYGEWLTEILSLYLTDKNPPKIRILDDLIKIILGGNPSKEGKGEHSFGILIIETDGEIRKNDTLRASFEGADFFKGRPNIKSTKIETIINSEEFLDYIKSPKPTSSECQNCELLSICGGGMPLYRWSHKSQFNNPSVYCRDHKLIISNILNALQNEGVVNA